MKIAALTPDANSYMLVADDISVPIETGIHRPLPARVVRGYGTERHTITRTNDARNFIRFNPQPTWGAASRHDHPPLEELLDGVTVQEGGAPVDEIGSVPDFVARSFDSG